MMTLSPGRADAGDTVMLGVVCGPEVTLSVSVPLTVTSPQRTPMAYEPTGVEAGITKVARKLPLASRGTCGPSPFANRFAPVCAGVDVSCTAAPDGQLAPTETFPEIVMVPPWGADRDVAVNTEDTDAADTADTAEGADAAEAAEAAESPRPSASDATATPASTPTIRTDVRLVAADRHMLVASSS
jgi:hypothetical protein